MALLEAGKPQSDENFTEHKPLMPTYFSTSVSHAAALAGTAEVARLVGRRGATDSVQITGFGEVLRRWDNFVELDPHVKDVYGIPVVKIHMSDGENERAMIQDMGSDPKKSVLNQFQQTHDLENLFVMDASSFASNPCQNPTLTIMALCVRSCGYLMSEFKRNTF